MKHISIKEQIERTILNAPKRNQKMLRDIKNSSKDELFKWCKFNQRDLNKHFKGNYDKFVLSILKIWQNAIPGNEQF